MAPIVHGLESEYSDKVIFSYLDIDDSANSDFKKQLGYKYQPHFFLVDGKGTIIMQWLGPVTAEDFRSVFDTYAQ